MSTLAERVAAGATWLDEHVPGWEHRIDLAKLNLSDTCLCVLGQVFEERAAAAWDAGDIRYAPSSRGHGGYWFAADLEWDGRYEEPLDYGFSLTSPSAAAWHDLQGEWVALIKARFDSGTLSG